MIKEVEIRIWGQVAGYAAYQNSRLAFFEYEKTFPLIYDLSPIMMPRSKQQVWSFDLNPTTYYGLPGLLADSLPDKYGQQIIDAHFTAQGLPLGDISALDRLCYVGSRAMGALEYFPNQNDININSEIEIATLVKLSREILAKRTEFKASVDKLETLLQISSSAGGARAKAVIAFNPRTNEIRSGHIKEQNFEYWIIKLDGVTNEALSDPQGYTNIEYACHLAALDCGIDMMESRLLKENSRNHFLTKRFDRTDEGEKLHMQTLCALAHMDYNEARVRDYDILFRVANLLSLSMYDKEQLFRRMVFNVVVRNHDDHTKNFSFLMDKEAKWRLSPAYDLTFSYNPDHYWLKEHNLLINGKSTDITRADLNTYAKIFHIKNSNEIIDQIIEVFSHFKKYSTKAAVSKEHSKFIEKQLLLNL